MKIFHLLTLNAATYVSKEFKNTLNIHNPNILNIYLTPEYSELASFYAMNMESLSQGTIHTSNNITNSKAFCNPAIIEDNEIYRVLSSPVFSMIRGTVSFFLYNISILRPIFISIHGKQVSKKLGIEELKGVLWKYTVMSKTDWIGKLLEIDPETEEDQCLENITNILRSYLALRRIYCTDLSYSELREKVLKTIPRYASSPEQFAVDFDSFKDCTSRVLHHFVKLDKEEKNVLFHFCNLAHGLTSYFTLGPRQSLNVKLYSALENYKTLFNWIIDASIKLSNSSISLPFYDESISPFSMLYPEIQSISGFVISLFKVIKAHQDNEYLPYDFFAFTQDSLNDLAKRTMNKGAYSLNNSSVERLMIIFTNFVNAIIKKINEAEKIEKQESNVFAYQVLEPIVNEFFKTLIKEFGHLFAPYVIPILC